MHDILPLPLSNTYGTLTLVQTDGHFYLELDDHSSVGRLEIDQITFENLVRFKDSPMINVEFTF